MSQKEGCFANIQDEESVSVAGFEIPIPETALPSYQVGPVRSGATFGEPAIFQNPLNGMNFNNQREMIFGSKYPTVSFESIAENGDPMALLQPDQS